jgi:integrase
MARHLRNPKIESRSARLRLKPSTKPTYFDLGGKLHLGYRRGKGAGVWVARRYIGDERYLTKTLGETDDLADANGNTVFNFAEAQLRARAWAADLDKADSIAALGPTITVRAAVREYLEQRRSTAADARRKLKHIAPIAEMPIAALTVDDLARWRASLLKKMSEASVRRIANDARAAFNFAADRHRDRLPATFRDTIRIGLVPPRGSEVENGRPQQILSDADVRRLVDAAWKVDGKQRWGGDLYRLILTLSATGARFSQVARLKVADLQVDERRILMPTSRKGRGGKKITQTAIPLGDDVIEALEPCTHGRAGSDVLLTRPYWRRVPGPGFGKLEVYARAEWRPAGKLWRAWRDIVEESELPAGTIVYSFRHSSIVRALRAGLPVSVVSRLHDTSAAMIESNYAVHIVSALEDVARRAVVPLAPKPVTPLRSVGG